MRKSLIYLSILCLVINISSCDEPPLMEEELPENSIEGIWLTDPSLSDDVNAFKYIVFEGSTLHFYGENEIGNREYTHYEFSLLNNGNVTGMEVFVKGNTSDEDWSFHLFYEFLDDGTSIYIEGLAMTFVGNRVDELPERESWVTNIEIASPLYSIATSYINDIAKTDNVNELWALVSTQSNTSMLKFNSLTGEVINENEIDNSAFYASLSYAGNCLNIIGKSEKGIDIVDCANAVYLETITLPSFYSIWSLCSDENAIWLAGDQISNDYRPNIVKIDFDGSKIDESVPFTKAPHSLAYGGGYLWLQRGNFVHKVDLNDYTTVSSYNILANTDFWGSGIEYIDGEILLVDYTNSVYSFTPE